MPASAVDAGRSYNVILHRRPSPNTARGVAIVDVQSLRRIDYFSRLDDDLLESIASQASEMTVGKDEVVLNEGAECEGLYMIVSGAVKNSRISAQGREQVLDILGPGRTFGDVPVFDGRPSHFTATALEPTVLGLIPRDMMHSLVRERGVVAESMLRIFAARLRTQARLAADLTHLDVIGRIARALVLYHESSGELRLQLRQQDLASSVGTTREVASRGLKHLEERGCLVRKGGVLEIVSIDRLTQVLDESIR